MLCLIFHMFGRSQNHRAHETSVHQHLTRVVVIHPGANNQTKQVKGGLLSFLTVLKILYVIMRKLLVKKTHFIHNT